MNVTVFGVGYVGLVTGACLAELGNRVCCYDIDAKKIAGLSKGVVPIHEPGLTEMVRRNWDAKLLHFSSDAEAAIQHADICFIAVGTPQGKDGSTDLTQVQAVATTLGRHTTGFKVVVNKSTVPVGTADEVSALIGAEIAARAKVQGVSPQGVASYAVVSNPEFLKEGAAIEDFMRPDRIVIGTDESELGQKAKHLMRTLYAPFNRHHERTLYMGVRSAELTKYAANTMLATRISFMNELANLAELLGADIEAVRKGVGSDPRIGYSFLYAGTGYGGSCFPKDIQSLLHTSRKLGRELKILSAVEEVNNRQKTRLVEKITQRLGSRLDGLKFAVWGLAFKPNTDDMRDAPSRDVILALIELGAQVCGYDPVAMREAEKLLSLDLGREGFDASKLTFSESPMAALSGAVALVIVTEWKVFRAPNFDEIKLKLKQPIIFDGRNLFDPEDMRTLGIEYHGIGR